MNDFLTQAIAMKALKNGGSGGAAGGNVEQIAKNKADIGLLKEDIGELNTSVFNIEESPNIFDKTKINQDKALVTWGLQP